MSAGPTGQRDETGEAATMARHAAKLADGGSSDDTEDTYVTYVMR